MKVQKKRINALVTRFKKSKVIVSKIEPFTERGKELRINVIEYNGDLHCSVLPSLIMGAIGGGTLLQTQKERLEIMGCYGEGKTKKFAEICGALCLAAEISIIAALFTGQFASAHEKHGRG